MGKPDWPPNKSVSIADPELKEVHAISPALIREYRIAKRESQRRFWGRFGVTQSRGSRFELGKEIPVPVLMLLRLYWKGIVSKGDLCWARQRTLSQRTTTDVNR
jgi:hypothetical protein